MTGQTQHTHFHAKQQQHPILSQLTNPMYTTDCVCVFVCVCTHFLFDYTCNFGAQNRYLIIHFEAINRLNIRHNARDNKQK